MVVQVGTSLLIVTASSKLQPGLRFALRHTPWFQIAHSPSFMFSHAVDLLSAGQSALAWSTETAGHVLSTFDLPNLLKTLKK